MLKDNIKHYELPGVYSKCRTLAVKNLWSHRMTMQQYFGKSVIVFKNFSETCNVTYEVTVNAAIKT